MNDDNYIERILEKLETVEDKELIVLVRKLIEEKKYLTEIANIDTLTGLYNRRILEHINLASGALMIDIDNFKQINDVYGHDVGDNALKSVAEVLKNNTRDKDYVIRLGGDEFTVLFEECPDEVLLKRAEDICNAISQGIMLGDTPLSVSVGLSRNMENDDIETLIKKADEALYDAKRDGKNRVSLYGDTATKLL